MKEYSSLLSLFLKHLNVYQTEVKNKTPQELYQPEDYMLSLGGKRIRPLLALIACDLFDKEASLALDSALSVELFHNFSLIHDDILDKAPLRRGNETVHTKWNTNIAILSGDVMLVKAFQVLEKYGFKEFKKLSVLFSQTAVEVCEGQQLDMNFEKLKLISAHDYIHMITLKTAVLLGCSLKMGSINAYASEQDQTNLYEFGKHLGIAFQLMDDYLDVYADTKNNFGKQIGGDIIANKKTFLLLKAFELADTIQKKKLTATLKLKEKDAAKKIETVLTVFDELNIKSICKSEVDKHTKIAIGFLEKVNGNTTKKQTLINFANELMKRQN